jgi:hypothetical protein
MSLSASALNSAAKYAGSGNLFPFARIGFSRLRASTGSTSRGFVSLDSWRLLRRLPETFAKVEPSQISVAGTDYESRGASWRAAGVISRSSEAGRGLSCSPRETRNIPVGCQRGCQNGGGRGSLAPSSDSQTAWKDQRSKRKAPLAGTTCPGWTNDDHSSNRFKELGGLDP